MDDRLNRPVREGPPESGSMVIMLRLDADDTASLEYILSEARNVPGAPQTAADALREMIRSVAWAIADEVTFVPTLIEGGK